MGIIYKYELPINPGMITTVSLPRDRDNLGFHNQNGKAQMWFLVDEADEDMENASFVIFGTGQLGVQRNWIHIGSDIFDAFVWHCFQVDDD